MDKAAKADGAREQHGAARPTDDGAITVEPRIKAAQKIKNPKEHCECCCCLKPSPKIEIVMGTCGSHQKNGRNLIICIDGTANQFGKKNTNVIELYNLLKKDIGDEQLTWYNSGIGTYARPHWRSMKYWIQIFLHKVDLAIAWNFDKTLLAAYQWLAENYQEGDRIFLFGFSRGAFQVRALSAMINKVGLLYKGNEMQIPFAYQLYAQSEDEPLPADEDASKTPWYNKLFPRDGADTPDGNATKKGKKVSPTEKFKNAFSREVKVHFVGAWDTVSSIGIARGQRVLPGTTEGMTHVCYFRHALALDERRVKFLPEYAWGGSSRDPTQKVQRNLHDLGFDKMNRPVQALEVWFPGTHSDIGGGNWQNEDMDRSRPPLRWMVFEANAAGLRTRDFERELLPQEQVEIKESLTGVWHAFEFLPFKRLTYSLRLEGHVARMLTRRPHCWASRKIHPGQKIHPAVLVVNEAEGTYLPQARLASKNARSLLQRLRGDKGEREEFWRTVRGDGSTISEWLIDSLRAHARVAVKRLVNGEDINSQFKRIMGLDNGPQALIMAVIEALEVHSHKRVDEPPTEPSIQSNWKLSDEVKLDLLSRATESSPISRNGLLVPVNVIKPFVAGFLSGGTEEHKKPARKFLDLYGDMCILQLKGHTDRVVSVAFTPDGKNVVSGSGDNTIRVWDAATGRGVGEPLRGHKGLIWSVAVSADGQRIVSGSVDGTVRIWDARTGQEVASSPLRGSAEIFSVAISHNGSRIVAGSEDGKIQVWYAATGEQAIPPLEGHERWVRSIAISADGNQIVSGSGDSTVRVWDIQSGAEVMKMTGHTEYVVSVAISPDRSKLVSGSGDGTVRIWDAKTGQQVGEPLRGHTGEVNSVVFSPDSRRIVSGSDDNTIRIWDVETGKQVGKPLQGHTQWVYSVAISSDGKLIASGSYDGTVRIWDGELALSADLVDD
ncbi:WD40 repeat-like protein [Coprinopsis marcescibilis]|uniref:WD40 repeat-like protein n=1 Tax=Coprinopsis marcescibilis TaxID=230819 RepID=A0A5C3KK83_COPMA|nr:WD40 repeat-like protein [Coprinopsis marcescibilis]